MSKSSHVGEGDTLTQNQNNSMSDDPGDGNRNSFTAAPEGGGPQAAPDEQGQEQLEAFGRKGSKQD